MLHALNAPLTPVQVTLPEGKTLSWLPLDLDVSPFDNSHTRKEGVSLTYKKVDGYAPFFAYLGQEGYGINVNLREGSMHVQKEAAAFLSHSLDYARRIIRFFSSNIPLSKLSYLSFKIRWVIFKNYVLSIITGSMLYGFIR